MRTLTLPALAFSIIWQLGGTADTGARLSGTTTSDGGRLPGVKVTAEGLHVRRTVVSDEQGAFDVGELPLGAYSVTTGIPGFRSQTKRVTLAEPGNRSLDFTLALGLLQIVDYIVPDAATAYRKADAVAHIRIERTVAPIACVDTFEAHHLVTVLSLAKGDVPPSVWFTQAHSGSCFHDGRLVEARDAHKSGEEYIVFLRAKDDSFFSLAGGSTTLRVEQGRVSTQDYRPIREGMTVAEVWAALRRLAR